MLPELGHFALILALLLAVVQSVFPLVGAWKGHVRWMNVARPAAAGQFVFLALAFVMLAAAFVNSDFSVAYIAQNSNSKLPIVYRITAVWGAHEGSLLLWALILSIWTIAVAGLSSRLPLSFASRVIGVLGVIATGFLSFILFTSDPFLRHLPALAEGNDLNPLLQDPGLVIHPPMLYTGYVGMAVAFAFAVAALLEGQVDTRWVRWSRPWTKVAWSFLTLGIALGSWWAYYELGWGGWWFWDPVENASFMPWLVATALIHSQAVTDKRGQFRGWTVLLAIFAFSLSLLGTFLVRSGVLTSVHAFAADPGRGIFVLSFLGLVTGGALTLYTIRAPKLAGGGKPFAAVSREFLILINNLLLTAAAAMVLLGTLFPLIGEALNFGKVSVGPPYFGSMFVILMAPMVLLVPFGPFSKWLKDDIGAIWQVLRLAAGAALLVVAMAWLVDHGLPWRALLAALGGTWVAAGTLLYVVRLLRDPVRRKALGHGEIAGMCIAHFGIALTVTGVLSVEALSVEKDVRLKPGEVAEVGAYKVRFDALDHYEGPNYVADRGHFSILSGDSTVEHEMQPEKRKYLGGQVQTEAAIGPGLTRDFYVALGEPLGDDGAWAVRAYVKPFIRFIWLGALFMMFGGFVAAADKRYREAMRRSRTTDEDVAGVGATA